MKKIVLFIVLCITGIGSIRAQVPEFGLKVGYFRDTATSANKTVAFGYDPTAVDTLEDIGNHKPTDKWYTELGGEQNAPPAGFDWDFRITGNFIGRFSDLHGGSYVDVRKKPNDTGFILLYEIDMVENDFSNARIQWDNTLIPAKIKHITLESNQNLFKPRLDMKNTSSLVFPSRDSIEYYGTMIIKVYYNMELADVNDPTQNSTNEFTIYPNPMDSRSKLHFLAKEDSRLTLSAYDVTGRKVVERVINAHIGENILDFSTHDFSSHSGVYMIRLSGLESGKPFDKSTTIIVR